MSLPVSDEILHAFIDDELALADREALVARIQADPELARRVYALRGLRDMVKLAYAEPPGARPPAVPVRWGFMQRCALGCLVLGVGLLVGWLLRGLEAGAILAEAPATPAMALHPVSLAQTPDPNRVMLHLDSAAPERMQQALDQAEHLLDQAEREGRIMQLELIANSHGLALLRAGDNLHAERIARMQQRHANLRWVACNQTIARFIGEGQTVELLPEVRTAPSAIGEIVSRLQQGWTYVRV